MRGTEYTWVGRCPAEETTRALGTSVAVLPSGRLAEWRASGGEARAGLPAVRAASGLPLRIPLGFACLSTGGKNQASETPQRKPKATCCFGSEPGFKPPPLGIGFRNLLRLTQHPTNVLCFWPAMRPLAPLCLRPSPSQQGEGRAPSYSTMAHSSLGPPWASRTPELRTLLPKLLWPPRVVAASRYLQSTPLPAGRALLTKRSQELVLWTTTSPLLGRGAHCPGLACPQQA